MKRALTKIIVGLLAVSIVFSPQLYAIAQEHETKAEVEFTPGTGPTKPVNPEEPGTEDPEGLPVSGSLAIVMVSDFGFGSIPVTTLNKPHDIAIERPNIQVVDLRGSGTGWRVSAKVSRFTSEGEETLPGAVILINDGRPKSVSTSAEPENLKNVRLITGGVSTPVIDAADGAGMGLWVMRWYPESSGDDAFIQLEIPPGIATEGAHSATIEWTLENAPVE